MLIPQTIKQIMDDRKISLRQLSEESDINYECLRRYIRERPRKGFKNPPGLSVANYIKLSEWIKKGQTS